MPSRNVIKEYAPQSYYHVYARGNSQQKIFLEASDYHRFLQLFERYLSTEPAYSQTGERYPNFRNQIKLLSYCLMSNHFHLLIYQEGMDDLKRFMQSLMTSYSRYFNLKHKRSGSLFETRYKASRIDRDTYLQHITRYIHLNPRRWQSYRYSSLSYYIHGHAPEWLTTKPILDVFLSRKEYKEFVEDYQGLRNELAELKYQLADL